MHPTFYQHWERKTWEIDRIQAAETPAHLLRLLSTRPYTDEERSGYAYLVTKYARVFDSALVEVLLTYAHCRTPLLENTNLDPELRASAVDALVTLFRFYHADASALQLAITRGWITYDSPAGQRILNAARTPLRLRNETQDEAPHGQNAALCIAALEGVPHEVLDELWEQYLDNPAVQGALLESPSTTPALHTSMSIYALDAIDCNGGYQKLHIRALCQHLLESRYLFVDEPTTARIRQIAAGDAGFAAALFERALSATGPCAIDPVVAWRQWAELDPTAAIRRVEAILNRATPDDLAPLLGASDPETRLQALALLGTMSASESTPQPVERVAAQPQQPAR